MNKEEYALFKKEWLETFRGYYKKGRMDKRKLKKNVFDNPKLLESQKQDFWNQVKGKNSEMEKDKEIERLERKIEEKEIEIQILQEKLKELERDLEDNYQPISLKEQIGYCDKDFYEVI